MMFFVRCRLDDGNGSALNDCACLVGHRSLNGAGGRLRNSEDHEKGDCDQAEQRANLFHIAS